MVSKALTSAAVSSFWSLMLLSLVCSRSEICLSRSVSGAQALEKAVPVSIE